MGGFEVHLLTPGLCLHSCPVEALATSRSNSGQSSWQPNFPEEIILSGREAFWSLKAGLVKRGYRAPWTGKPWNPLLRDPARGSERTVRPQGTFSFEVVPLLLHMSLSGSCPVGS